MTAQRKVAERKVAQGMVGRQMMYRHRRRGLLRDGVAGEAYGKYGATARILIIGGCLPP
jgi:ribosomal protein L35AE/L33A